MNIKTSCNSITPVIAPLVEACKANGIPKTSAWDLVKRRLLETVSIGRRRYALLSSLETLPTRLAALKGGKQ